MNPESHPEMFDLPGDRRPRKIYRAWGSKLASARGARKKKWRHMDVFVNSPTLPIATRAAKRHFSLHNYKIDSCYEISWKEYGEILARSGFQVSGI